ncbi:MAG: amine dehydrogenase large subunit [bacterium]|nr:methylamine utilization protein MauE [Gammaproteobacteria bacterium]HIL95643.1 methylamine utilization protein MauE [Pseudomonadales bacterium]
MHLNGLTLLAVCLYAVSAIAEIQPEEVGRTKMKAPQDTWLLARSRLQSAYIFDAATGDMQGLLALSFYTPAVQPNLSRGEIYAAESFYSRSYRGDRTDVVSIYDLESLSPVDEIIIPNKVAALPFRQYIGLLDDEKHLIVFNLTPAQSLSVVDIAKRKFVGEIKTPGCSLVMPTEKRSFLQICGDGTLQLIQLDKKGGESARVRSEVFFDLEEDPVYDKPVPTKNSWLLISFEGKAMEATVDKGKVTISDAWSLTTDEDKEERWKPGGGQLIAFHQELDLMYVLMHQGEEHTHEDAGSEVWIFDRAAQRRVAKIKLETTATDLLVSQNDKPLLTVSTDGKLHVFDAETTRLVRSIDLPSPGVLQAFR